ncbi:tetratricopeptide repeat protein [Candidatus Nitrospira salsa]
MSTILLEGCVGHSERWTAQGTTKLEHGAFHSLDLSIPIAEKSHSLNLRDEKGEHPETFNEVQAVVKDAAAMEFSGIQILEQDGGQLLGLVGSELPNNMREDLDFPVTVGPQLPNVILEDEPLSVLWVDGEIRQTELPKWYEISQVPFPGIEAIAVPGYSSEKEVENDPLKPISGEDDTLVNKRKKSPVLPIDNVSVAQEHLEVHHEDTPSFPKITGKTVKNVAETTNEKPIHMPSPSLSAPTLPDDRLKSVGAPQEEMLDQGQDLVKERKNPLPRSTPSEIMTEEVVVQKKSPLDSHEKTGRLNSDEEGTLSRLVGAEKEKPSAAENALRSPNTTSKLVLRKEPSGSQAKKMLAPSETEVMLAEANSHRVKEKSKKENDITSSIFVDREPGQSLTESPLPSHNKPSTFVNVPEKSVRKNNDTMALAPGQSDQACSQSHTSLTRYQSQTVLAALSRSIQTFLLTNRTTQNNLELHDCYRQRASIYFQLNDPTQAISDIDRVLQESQSVNVQRSSDLFFRGRVYASMNASQHVIDDVSEALQLGLDGLSKAHAYYLRGLSYLRLQQFDAGLKDLSLSCRDDFPKACALLEKIM